jgi:hypothetical protein
MIHLDSDYQSFISECRAKNFAGVGEKHHIRPKSFGGDDSQDNLILLSFADHLHAHYLLWKSEIKNSKPGPMTKAFFRMMGKRKNEEYCREYHGEIYEQVRNDFSVAQSLKLKGRKQSKEHIEKRLLKGKDHPFYGKVYTEEERKVLSEKNKKPKSVETRENMKIAQQKRVALDPTLNKGIKNNRADRSIKILVHPEEGVFIGTKFAFHEKYPEVNFQKLTSVCRTGKGSIKGWSLNNFTGRFTKNLT